MANDYSRKRKNASKLVAKFKQKLRKEGYTIFKVVRYPRFRSDFAKIPEFICFRKRKVEVFFLCSSHIGRITGNGHGNIKRMMAQLPGATFKIAYMTKDFKLMIKKIPEARK